MNNFHNIMKSYVKSKNSAKTFWVSFLDMHCDNLISVTTPSKYFHLYIVEQTI